MPQLQRRLESVLLKQDRLQRELWEKDENVGALERRLREASGVIEELRQDNRELNLQVAGLTDQCTNIQESSSEVLEMTALKKVELETRQTRLLNRASQLEDENGALRLELTKTAEEVQGLRQTVLLLRSEQYHLVHQKKDLETRLKACDASFRFRLASQGGSFRGSQIDRSLSFDHEAASYGSQRTLRLEDGARMVDPKPALPARRDQQAARADINSGYCAVSKCALF